MIMLHNMYRAHHPTFIFFFFNDTATTEIYTLSLHDALPISVTGHRNPVGAHAPGEAGIALAVHPAVLQHRRMHHAGAEDLRSEEHTSELQSQSNLVCRLLLEKKKYHYIQKRSD